ncbi:MAG: CHAT domain-containing protein [Lewinellaceae bacterium]|nr:CHAT domain-containing protein [Phaeodactylibacter sp.]MCB9351720.1 CHAT domain-containing protein [Lewinellaceae bacterium]
MKNLPVILLTFANDRTAYLDNLKRESRHLNQALEPWEDKYAIKVYREEQAEAREIIHAMNRFDGTIIIFHYAGHVAGNRLVLENSEGHGEGLAQLLKRQKALKLAFLNGCSTQGQVEGLLELGIPAVIATTTQIGDSQATGFAEYFYQKLANGGTLAQSFEHACASLAFEHGAERAPRLYRLEESRGAGFEDAEGEDMPWGLFYKAENAEVLDWVLPRQLSLSAGFDEASSFELNGYIYSILGEMAANNSKLEEDIQSMEDDRELLELIIKNFPWNIGAQVGKLVSNDPAMLHPGLPRLEQLLNTYLSAAQFMFFTTLSQVWDECNSGQLAESDIDFEEAFCITPDEFSHFDYVAGFRQLLNVLTNHGIAPFLEEIAHFSKGLDEKQEAYDAYLFMESIRHRLNQPENLQTQAGLLCEDAEYFLSVFLSGLAFMVNYQLVTVRDIVFCNYRHRPAEYRHYLGRLNAHTEARLGLFREPRAYKDFLDSDSVILLKGLETIKPYLNLSPFFIDKNAYSRDKLNSPAMDLFTFSFCKGKEYIYIKSSSNLLQASKLEHNQLSTGLEVKQDSRNRRLKSKYLKQRDEDKAKPFIVLEEQFEKLRNIWQQ